MQILNQPFVLLITSLILTYSFVIIIIVINNKKENKKNERIIKAISNLMSSGLDTAKRYYEFITEKEKNKNKSETKN